MFNFLIIISSFLVDTTYLYRENFAIFDDEFSNKKVAITSSEFRKHVELDSYLILLDSALSSNIYSTERKKNYEIKLLQEKTLRLNKKFDSKEIELGYYLFGLLMRREIFLLNFKDSLVLSVALLLAEDRNSVFSLGKLKSTYIGNGIFRKEYYKNLIEYCEFSECVIYNCLRVHDDGFIKKNNNCFKR